MSRSIRALRTSHRHYAIPMQHAASWVAVVYERLEHLPEAFPLCRDTCLRAKEYRKIALPHHNYLLIYRIEKRIVYIVGFFHMRENYRDKL